MFRVDCEGERVGTVRIVVRWRRREEKEGVDAWSFVGVPAVVALGETPNHEPFFFIKFHGLNCLFRWGLVEQSSKLISSKF